MLLSINNLLGYALEARDGRIGKVEDFYFDDYVWRVRYLVAGTGGWLLRKSVLLAPATLDSPRSDEKRFPVMLTQEQVRNSPDIDTDKPVSRQMEESLQTHYGWPSYWSIEPVAMAPLPELAEGISTTLADIPAGDPHLRSVREVTGYEVRALNHDSQIGEVTDFVLDNDDWTVRYIVVHAAEKRPSREFVLNPWWMREIDWANRTMHFDITALQIQSAPGFDPDSPLDRDYELRLHEYYGRSGYWERAKRP